MDETKKPQDKLYFELKVTENWTLQNLWHAAKEFKFIDLNAHVKKEKQSLKLMA